MTTTIATTPAGGGAPAGKGARRPGNAPADDTDLALAAFARVIGEARGGVGTGLTDAAVAANARRLAHGAELTAQGVWAVRRIAVVVRSLLRRGVPEDLSGQVRRDVETLQLLDYRLAVRLRKELRTVLPASFGAGSSAAPSFEHGVAVGTRYSPPESTKRIIDDLKIAVGRVPDPARLAALRSAHPDFDESRLRRMARRPTGFSELEKAALVRSAQRLLNTRGVSKEEYTASVLRLLKETDDKQYERIREDVRERAVTFVQRAGVSLATRLTALAAAPTGLFVPVILGAVAVRTKADVTFEERGKKAAARWHRELLKRSAGGAYASLLMDDGARKRFEEWANGGEARPVAYTGRAKAGPPGAGESPQPGAAGAIGRYNEHRAVFQSNTKRYVSHFVRTGESLRYLPGVVRGPDGVEKGHFAPELTIGPWLAEAVPLRWALHNCLDGRVHTGPERPATGAGSTGVGSLHSARALERSSGIAGRFGGEDAPARRSVQRDADRLLAPDEFVKIFDKPAKNNLFAPPREGLSPEEQVVRSLRHTFVGGEFSTRRGRLEDEWGLSGPHPASERRHSLRSPSWELLLAEAYFPMFGPVHDKFQMFAEIQVSDMASERQKAWLDSVDRLSEAAAAEIRASVNDTGAIALRAAGHFFGTLTAFVRAGTALVDASGAFDGTQKIPVVGSHMDVRGFIRDKAAEAFEKAGFIGAVPGGRAAADRMADWYAGAVVRRAQAAAKAGEFVKQFVTTGYGPGGTVVDVDNPDAAAIGRAADGFRQFDFGRGKRLFSAGRSAVDLYSVGAAEAFGGVVDGILAATAVSPPTRSDAPYSGKAVVRTFARARMTAFRDAQEAGRTPEKGGLQKGAAVDLRGLSPSREVILIGEFDGRWHDVDKCLHHAGAYEKLKDGSAVVVFTGGLLDRRSGAPGPDGSPAPDPLDVFEKYAALKTRYPTGVYSLLAEHDLVTTGLLKRQSVFAREARRRYGTEWLDLYQEACAASPLAAVGKRFAAVPSGPAEGVGDFDALTALTPPRRSNDLGEKALSSPERKLLRRREAGSVRAGDDPFAAEHVEEFLSGLGLAHDARLLVGLGGEAGAPSGVVLTFGRVPRVDYIRRFVWRHVGYVVVRDAGIDTRALPVRPVPV